MDDRVLTSSNGQLATHTHSSEALAERIVLYSFKPVRVVVVRLLICFTSNKGKLDGGMRDR